MPDENLYDNDDSGLFHDVRMILDNEVINFMHKYGVNTQRSITTMREVLDHLESENTMTSTALLEAIEDLNINKLTFRQMIELAELHRVTTSTVAQLIEQHHRQAH